MRSSPSKPAEGVSRARLAADLAAVPIAHRGLHGGPVVENSRAAFTAAIARGHGIELDVQASRDGEAMVFHDYDLDRLVGDLGPLSCLTSAALCGIRLKGTEETIPPLAEIVRLVGGGVPLVIEVKARHRRVSRLCRSVRRALSGYEGPVGVMSFNPSVGRWFRFNAPGILRGLVVTEQDKRRMKGWIERRWSVARARPDFLAYDIRDLPSRFAAGQRARGLPILTWTVRRDADREAAARHADQIIYEEV